MLVKEANHLFFIERFGFQCQLKMETLYNIIVEMSSVQMKLQDQLLQNQNLQNFIEYNHNYSIYGKNIDQIDICKEMLQLVASHLPQNYRAVDLGCNTRNDIAAIESLCVSSAKVGTFFAVDPYSQRQDILKMTSQEFVSRHQYSNLDIIIAKYSMHFNKNQKTFFQNAHQRLTDNGFIFILAKTKQCQYPWTEPLQQTFNDSCFKEQEIPLDLFQCKKVKRLNKIQVNKQIFTEFVEKRSYSNLLKNSQQEIDQCAKFIRNMPVQNISIDVVTILYILQKKNIS